MDLHTKFLLQDMLENARIAVEFIGNADVQAFSANRQLIYAVRSAVELVGEAASQVYAKARAGLPTIPWRKAISMRNKLIHGYRTFKPAILFATVRDQFPALIAELERILNERPKDGA